MIIADTNILSTFACINRLDLLFQVADTEVICLSPAIVSELQEGLNRGCAYLQPLLYEVQKGATYSLIHLTLEEASFCQTLPRGLQKGEKEAIAVCAFRDAAFLTNDRRAHRYCQANFVASFDLKMILRRLWQATHSTKAEVQSLIEAIEQSEEGMVIKDQHEIWR